ncbi:MAG TPA: hypothetical protein DCR93_00860 [Cytophagales bacterium]|nr:hypothetical protein [Cytophagales bacterium]HAP58107.1 hypothetical protein [Cytophagales bacterium]
MALNSFNYFGDLSPTSNFYSTDISFTRPGFGALVNYRAFSNRIDTDFAFNWGTLRGDDFSSSDPDDEGARYNHIRNMSFRNQIYEFSVGAKVFLFEDGDGGTLQRRLLNPYVHLGGAIFYHNPQAQVPEFDMINNYNAAAGVFSRVAITEETHGANPGDWVSLRPLRTEGQGIVAGRNPYSLIQGALVGGMGVRYRLLEYVDLSFDINIRYLFTDYIDDVSTTYVDLGLLESDLARVMSDRSLENLEEFGGTLSDEYIRGLYPEKFQEYVSEGNGETYAILPGRGRSSDLNQRGNPSNDIYYIASFKLVYILGGSLKTSNQFR